MKNDKLRCPTCKGVKVAVTTETMYMVGTGNYYHSLEWGNPEAKATCLKCNWTGFRRDLVTIRKGEQVPKSSAVLKS